MPAINLQTSASGPKINLRVGNKTYVLGEQKTETVTNTVYVDREVPVYVDREVPVYVDKYIPLMNYGSYISQNKNTAAFKFEYPVQITGTIEWFGSSVLVFGSYTSATETFSPGIEKNTMFWKNCPAIWVRDTGKVSIGFTGDGGLGRVLGTTTNALSANTEYNFTFKYKPSESRLILTINGETLNKNFASDYSVNYLPFRFPYSEKADGMVTSLKLAYWDGN